MTVRTRFAPSPTGYLHIGGVRTALFNWLFARKHGGQFILRIDDTDQQRNVAEALQPILDGFKWLGLDWDEGPTPDGTDSVGPHGPYFQSQRSEKYQAAVEELLARGFAYKDYAKTEEVQAEREAAEKEKRSFVYSRNWMAESDADCAKWEGEGRQAVVRLKMPRDGACEFHDHVRGDVSVQWASEQDHVIQRADGSFIYHLASVVDDHDMEISHVIRAAEHLSNTPRQIFIAQGLGYTPPEFAHVPVVAEPGSKTKLSKRKLTKYLKNKEFADLHHHGLQIAAMIDEQLRAISESRGLSLAHSDREEILEEVAHDLITPDKLEQILQKLPSNYTATQTEKANTVEVIKIVLEQTLEVIKNPELLVSYEHGEAIVKELGLPTTATFNPVLIDFYSTVGYLPDAITNYLVLLGWSLDDKTEDFTREEMIQHFSLQRVNKAPASFDPSKLSAFQNRYMQRLNLKKKVAMCVPFLQKAGWIADPPPCDTAPKVTRILEGASDRVKVAGDILDYPEFFVAEDALEYDEKAFDKRVKKEGAPEVLTKFKGVLADVQPFDAEHTEKALKQFVEDEDIKIGDIIHALRVAVTGKGVGIGMFDSLEIIGKESCLNRIDRALAMAQSE